MIRFLILITLVVSLGCRDLRQCAEILTLYHGIT